MRRAIWFLIKLAIVIAVALWLVEQPGTVTIPFQGYIFEMPVGVMVLGIIALMVLAAVLYRVYRGIRHAPNRVERSWERSRREKGYRALTQGMVAVAAGDADTARRMSRRADGLLHNPPLTRLLQAQAAQLSGDDSAAKTYFEAMLERPETEFLGLRGLLTQALRDDDPVRALGLAQRARAIQPKTPWVLQTCFDLEVRLRRWSEALATLNAAAKAHVMDQQTARHYRAAILIERSREAEADDRADEALSSAHKAVGLEPEFVPAVVREARLLAQGGRRHRATRLIEKTWARMPHPALAEVYRELGPEGEAPLDRIKRFERLAKARPDHPETLTALGEAELQAELWGTARTHLQQAEAERPTRRLYRLLAELETREHGDTAAARDWLMKAEAAPPDPAWVCRSCGNVAAVWAAACNRCGAFDSFQWQPPQVDVHLPSAEQPAPERLPAA
jgi:HemY protein